MSLRLSVLAILALSSMALAWPVLAQSKSVVVQRDDADITILPDGDVQFDETWEVQFAGGPFDTAFRTLPLGGVADISAWGVREGDEVYRESAEGEVYTFRVSASEGSRTIRWYFPSTTDGRRTFGLRYTLHGALWIDPEGDEFYWKFVEGDREYTIDSATVRLYLPVGFERDELRAITYRNGQEDGGGRVVDGQTIEFHGSPFGPGVEWEIRVQFPHGVVTTSAAPVPAAGEQEAGTGEAGASDRLIVAALMAVILGSGLLGPCLLWRSIARSRAHRSLQLDAYTAYYGGLVPEDLSRGGLKGITVKFDDFAARITGPGAVLLGIVLLIGDGIAAWFLAGMVSTRILCSLGSFGLVLTALSGVGFVIRGLRSGHWSGVRGSRRGWGDRRWSRGSGRSQSSGRRGSGRSRSSGRRGGGGGKSGFD